MRMLFKWVDALARAVIRLIGKVSPKLGGMCERLWNNTELVTYLFAGVATTAVNYVVYFLATRPLGLDVLPGTWVAWVCAVLFGYIVNKRYVFKTHCAGVTELLKEAGGFFAMRLVSLGMETVLMYVTVSVLHLNDLAMKLIVNLIVILVNYVFSKKVIFRKK